MEEQSARGSKAKPSLPFSETILVLLLTAMTYVYAFVSQRAYLRTFGVDEFFTSVAIEDIVRSAVWLLASAYILIQLLQWPTGFYASTLRRLLVFRLALLFFLIGFFAYQSSGINWITLAVLAIGLLALGLELYWYYLFRRYNGGNFDDYFADVIQSESDYMRSTVDGRLSDRFGSGAFSLVLVALLVPYALGEIVGHRKGDRQRDFLGYVEDGEMYLVIHEVSGVFISVGYEELENSMPLLNGNLRLLNADAISKVALTERQFDTSVLREEPFDKPGFMDWYRNDLKPLFTFESGE